MNEPVIGVRFGFEFCEDNIYHQTVTEKYR